MKRRAFIITSCFSIFSILFLDSFFFERFFIRLKKFRLLKNKEEPSLKIIQLSDLHLTKISFTIKKAIEKINEIKPDVVCLTGDVIDKKKNLHLLAPFLDLFDSQIQKVAILGNWEYWSELDLKELKQIYQSKNCDLLINESKQYIFQKRAFQKSPFNNNNLKNKTLAITGIDDLVAGKPDYQKAESEYKESDHHIVLNHCPLYRDEIQKLQTKNIDFILSGHTHGGQISFFGWTPKLPDGVGNYIKGWYKETTPHLFVSIGIGTSLIPFRFCAPSEMILFELN